MTRLIFSALILLVILIGAEQYLDAQRENHHITTQTVRRLPGNESLAADTIRAFTLQLADTTWTYTFQNGNWHYPEYENAFAFNDRVKRFLEGVVESEGTVVAFDRSEIGHYGLSEQVIKIALQDSAQTFEQNIQIGRSLPGRDANEAYMAPANNDTIFHMHTDPRRLLAWERESHLPPLLDPKLLPSALSRRAIVQIKFTSGSVRHIERIEIESEEENARPQDGPRYDWYAQVDGKRQQVVNGSVYTYISFLNRIKYSHLHAQVGSHGFAKKSLIMIDDNDAADTLDIGQQSPEGDVYIRHRTTGQILSITQAKADLLLPTPTRLDTLPHPSVYDKAEPTGPFSLASP